MTKSPKQAFDEGMGYFKKREFEKAVESFTEAIWRAPDYTDAYYYRGIAFQKGGASDDEIEYCDWGLGDFTEVIRRKPEFAPAYFHRGISYIIENQYDNALSDFDEVIRLDPRFVAAYVERGELYFQDWGGMTNYDLAIANFTKAIEIEPANCRAYKARARVHNSREEHDKAIADFTEAIKLAPESRDLYYERGKTFLRKGENDKALVDLNEVISRYTTWACAYRVRAHIQWSKGDLESAIADVTEAIRLYLLKYPHGNTVMSNGGAFGRLAYRDRGRMYHSKGKYALAIDDYEQAVSPFCKTDPAPHRYLAWLLATCPEERFRDGTRAIKEAKRACDITKEEDWRDIDALAAAYAEDKQYDKAVEHEEKALALAPDTDKEDCRERLQLYRNGRPYRES